MIYHARHCSKDSQQCTFVWRSAKKNRNGIVRVRAKRPFKNGSVGYANKPLTPAGKLQRTGNFLDPGASHARAYLVIVFRKLVKRSRRKTASQLLPTNTSLGTPRNDEHAAMVWSIQPHNFFLDVTTLKRRVDGSRGVDLEKENSDKNQNVWIQSKTVHGVCLYNLNFYNLISESFQNALSSFRL